MSPRDRSTYRELVERTAPPPPPERNVEDDLDALDDVWQQREMERSAPGPQDAPDPIQVLRDLTRTELVIVFLELMEKYSQVGIAMEMDASNFLEGGREIKFEFRFGEHRLDLQGTVTTEAIAFHETRFAPDVRGELASGPMLRLRHLDAKAFRDFLCERLTILLRGVMRQSPGRQSKASAK